jgi:hypothetical protein
VNYLIARSIFCFKSRASLSCRKILKVNTNTKGVAITTRVQLTKQNDSSRIAIANDLRSLRHNASNASGLSESRSMTADAIIESKLV